MAVPLTGGPVRKVTGEDKEAARNELLPRFGEEGWNEAVKEFADKRGLKEPQVIAIVLHLRAKAAATPED